MARHDDYAGLDLGLILVARAFSTALAIAEHTGSVAMVVDAKNDALVSWYAAAGFQSFPDTPRTLYMMNKSMAAYLDAMADKGVACYGYGAAYRPICRSDRGRPQLL